MSLYYPPTAGFAQVGFWGVRQAPYLLFLVRILGTSSEGQCLGQPVCWFHLTDEPEGCRVAHPRLRPGAGTENLVPSSAGWPCPGAPTEGKTPRLPGVTETTHRTALWDGEGPRSQPELWGLPQPLLACVLCLPAGFHFSHKRDSGMAALVGREQLRDLLLLI